MTTVSLSELLDIRDESIRVHPRRARLRLRIPKVSFAWLMPVLAFIHSFVHRHGLTLFGCTCIVISAATITPALGWLAAGASFFFLELRRRDER